MHFSVNAYQRIILTNLNSTTKFQIFFNFTIFCQKSPHSHPTPSCARYLSMAMAFLSIIIINSMPPNRCTNTQTHTCLCACILQLFSFGSAMGGCLVSQEAKRRRGPREIMGRRKWEWETTKNISRAHALTQMGPLVGSYPLASQYIYITPKFYPRITTTHFVIYFTLLAS